MAEINDIYTTPFADNDQLDFRAANSRLSNLEDARARVIASQEVTQTNSEIDEELLHIQAIAKRALDVIHLRKSELDDNIFSEAA